MTAIVTVTGIATMGGAATTGRTSLRRVVTAAPSADATATPIGAEPDVKAAFLTRLLFVFAFVAPMAHAETSLGPSTLLEGSRAFREGRFPEALVAFRVAERSPGVGHEALWYSAATLYKLGRVEEALEAFDRAGREAPEVGDSILDFYLCSAAYEARLYLTSDDRLERLAAGAGPKLGAEIRRLRGQIALLFTVPPDARVIDWYLARARQLQEAGRRALAKAYYSEAAALSRRRGEPHRLDEALDGVREASVSEGVR